MKRRRSQYKRGRLTEDEEAKIVELGERLGPGPIALKLNRHPATVNFAMYRLGVHRPVEPRRGDAVFHRRGKPVRAFSAEEDTFIEEKRIAGLKIGEILRAHEERFGFKRPRNSIRVRLLMLASKDAA